MVSFCPSVGAFAHESSVRSAICPCPSFPFAFIFWHSRATIESRSGFRYGGVSGLGGGCFVGGTPTLLERESLQNDFALFPMILLEGVVRWKAGGFSGFLGLRMPEDPREWETERGSRAEVRTPNLLCRSNALQKYFPALPSPASNLCTL